MKDLSLKDHYKNQKFNNLHEFFWGFGSAFHTVYAVVPLFLKELGAPDVIATSSAGLFSIIIAMPMLFTAALTRNVNNIFLLFLILENLPSVGKYTSAFLLHMLFPSA